MRWAQVRGMGGDSDLARLLSTRTILASATEDESFWQTVIAFLIRHAPLASGEVVDIVRFIQRQRFEPADRVWRWGAGQAPLQPNFALQGRTLQTFRRHMAHWQADIRQQRVIAPPAPSTLPWEPTDIRPLQFSDGSCIWTIEELLSADELETEGQSMQHCVATYRHSCACRRTSIWSMKAQKGGQSVRVLTVEVDPATRQIRQAKGKLNSAPSEIAQTMLQRWATQERLRF